MEEKNLKQKDISLRIANLSISVQDVIASSEIAEANAQIRDRYKLTDKQLKKMLQIILKVFLKDIPIRNFPEILKNELKIKRITAEKISLEIAQKEFFLAREHLPDVENLIKNLGGEIPKIIPKPKPKILPKKKPNESSKKENGQKIIQKDIQSAIRECDKLEDQIISSSSIKIIGISENIKPSIKNWLTDYIQSVGAGSHSNIERSNYLYHNSNAIKLKESERKLLAEILKSYDEETTLPIKKERLDLKFLKQNFFKERLKR
jgi:hypothetical protein